VLESPHQGSDLTMQDAPPTSAVDEAMPLPVAYASSPVHRDGRLVGAVVRFSDITEQKRASEGMQLLAESGRVLSSSLEATRVRGRGALSSSPRAPLAERAHATALTEQREASGGRAENNNSSLCRRRDKEVLGTDGPRLPA
jgi:hypothetical protein